MRDFPPAPIPRMDELPPTLRAQLPLLMARAISSARFADAPFGCVLAEFETGEPILDAPNTNADDPTAHAEMNALRLLARQSPRPEQVALVSTAEPCAMCAAACWWSGVSAIIFGTSIATLMRHGWRQIDIGCAELLARSRPLQPPIVLGGFRSHDTDPLYSRGP